jgi:Ca2+-transporting ATPase
VVAQRLVTGARGLTEEEARARLARHGPNRLDEQPPTPRIVVLSRQFRSPLIFILLTAVVVTLLLGEHLDAAVIAVVLSLNAVIGFTQERRAESAVRALMKLVVPTARVVRGGRDWEISSRDVVPGDLLVLEPGTRVPADVRLTAANGLQVDESLLTGESAPVTKHVDPVTETAALADRSCMAYTGSIVTVGRGSGLVVATGSRTELGRIAGMMRVEQPPPTPLQERMDRFGKVVGVAVAMAASAAFVSGIILGESAHGMFLVAVALAVSAVPEGLPVAVTITLAVGVARMARRHAVIRRLAAVETLGSTTVIGSDKTGTLTENRMTVEAIWTAGHHYAYTGTAPYGGFVEGDEPAVFDDRSTLHLTLLAGVLTNDAEAYRRDGGVVTTGDPTEVAMLTAAMSADIEPEEARIAYPMHAAIPFDPSRRYSASIRTRHGRPTVFAKGSPERIVDMCTHMLTDDGVAPLERALALEAAHELAGRGLRVLALAYRPIEHPPQMLEEPSGLVLVGLQGMMDPPRAGVREAVASCRGAGIRVLMITGDHAATAAAIAGQVGITDGGVLTGAQLDSLDEAQFRARTRDTSVFARVSPEQKLRIVETLRQDGEVVAVTGDGVNDAPALKAAQIGVAMGRGGTDVAREAAEMVLTDDDFVSITAAVEEGRVTFDNIRKVAFFLVSTGAAEVSVILTAVWLRWPLVFLPAQLLWLNLVTNGLQDVALAFEPGERGILMRPPRGPHEGVLSRTLWERTVLAGLVMGAGTLVMFRWELHSTGSLTEARTVALSTMVLFQVFQAGNARSERVSLLHLRPWSNPFLFVATAAALALHVAALYLAPTQYVLRVEPVDAAAWLRIVAVATTIVAAVEVHKALRRSRHSEP